MLMCTYRYVYVCVWITELLQHVMALLDNYNILRERIGWIPERDLS